MSDKTTKCEIKTNGPLFEVWVQTGDAPRLIAVCKTMDSAQAASRLALIES